MADSIILSDAELLAITGYQNGTKRLNVLHDRGYLRAYRDKDGVVILTRAHYEAVERGELHQPRKSANLTFLKQA